MCIRDSYAPVGGEVVGVNEDLEGAPELINDDPYGDGWICRISISDPSELDTLLDSVSYSELIAE